MTDINKNDIVDIDDFVDSLCERNGISSSEVYGYAKDHYDELQTMDRIFKLETEEDIRHCMALARILTPQWADGIIAFSRMGKFNKVKLNWIEEPDISIYSLRFISAFYYNPQFLKEAWDWCAITYQEARYQETVVIFKPNMLQAATSGEGDPTIWLDEDYDRNGISGELRCIERQGGMREFRFRVKESKGYENITKLKLVIKKGDITNIPLYRLEESESPGEKLAFTTKPISFFDENVEIYIEIVTDDNDV